MSESIFAPGGMSTDERNERARRAVKNFRAMQHSLTGYARAITGRKDVTVELAVGPPRTDNKKIYFRPPMALGDNTPHQRMYCDKRDSMTLLQLCPACAVREEVLISIIHEISHMAFGTFEEVKPRAVADAMDRAIKEYGSKYATKIAEAWDKIPDWKKSDYLNLADLISPFLQILVNALEDARVDEAMFTARKGTRAMFDAVTMKIFREGIELEDGTVALWRDRPLNSQALIGVFVLCCGYKYEGWFAPEVEEALGDDKLRLLCAQVDTIRSAEGTYNLAFPILARLRELGFCRSEKDPEDEEPDTQENNEDEPSQGDDQAPQEEQDGDPGDDDAGADEPESAEQPGEPDDQDDSGEGDSDADGSDGSGSDDEGEAGDPKEATEGAGDSDDDAVGDGSEDGEEGDAPGGSAGEDDADGGAEVPEGSDIGGDDEGSASGEGDSADEGAPSPGDGSPGQDQDIEADGSPGGGTDAGDGVPGAGSEPGDATSDDDGDRPDHSDGGPEDGPLGDPGVGSPLDGEGDDGPGEGDREGLEDGRLDDRAGSPEALDPDSDERVDTGADEGRGGDKVDTNPKYGDSDQAIRDVFIFNKHEVFHSEPEHKGTDERADDKALDMAIMQGGYFETPSVNVAGVREHTYAQRADDTHADAWNNYDDPVYGHYLKLLGGDSELNVEESFLAPALREMRRVFADNKRSHMDRNRKDGKVNAKVLGKRAPFGDPRLFQKKRVPGKRDYKVILGLDVSGSTVGENLHLIKRAAKAQAELLNRMGIDFAIYAHSGSGGWGSGDLMLDIYCIKDFNEPWDSTRQEALNHLCADAQNLDGHTLEFYRRRIEREIATDKIIMYYTDGKMPAENHDEELEILQREIRYCRSRGIHLMGVGIRTDSPVRHGLPTVQVDDDADLVKVIRHLEAGLLRRR